jgi:hypothetical protein
MLFSTELLHRQGWGIRRKMIMENVMMLTRTWFVRSIVRTGRRPPGKDYCYRAAILFLPQCGKFYCHRERRRGDVGVPGTFVAHDMSWLRLQRTESHGGREVSYLFGADSFVKLFFPEFTGHGVCHDDGRPGQRYLDGEHRVSAWRISTGRTRGTQQNRVI